MTTLLLFSAGRSVAFFPLIPLLLKGIGLGAKKHLGRKIAVESAKEAAKDKIKEKISDLSHDREDGKKKQVR